MERYDLRTHMLVMHRNTKIGGTHLARVIKVNPKTVKIQYETGQVWTTGALSLSPAPADAEFNIDEAEGLELGDPVRFLDNAKAGTHTYVIIDIKAGPLYKVARLRNSKDRYFYNVVASSLVLVPEGEVHA